MKKNSSTVEFGNGLNLDFNPITFPEKTYCNALNATLLTSEGNEGILLNDMGNCKVGSAKLPSGYIPLGTTEYAGIIYIVSYNPLTDKCLIGSFPSPQRNFSLESEIEDNLIIDDQLFIKETKDEFGNKIKEIISLIDKSKISKDIILNPGDKFIVYGDGLNLNISETTIKEDTSKISYYNDKDELQHRYIKFSLATIDSNGRIIYLSDLLNREIIKSKYLKMAEKSEKSENPIYNIFNSKIAGNLYLISELEVINSFNVTYRFYKKIENNEEVWYLRLITTFEAQPEINLASVKLYDYITNEVKEIEYNPLIKQLLPNDPDYSISNSVIFDIKVEDKEIHTYTLVPVMPYADYTQLKQTLSFNFENVGREEIQSEIWQYFKQDNSIAITFDLSNYSDKYISKVDLLFYDEICSDNLTQIEKTPIYTEYITNKKSYSGYNNVIIDFTESGLKKDALYRVIIKVYQEDQETPVKYIYHWLYTNGVYNDYYNNIDKLNFDKEYLPLSYLITTDPKEKESIITEPKELTKEEKKNIFLLDASSTLILNDYKIKVGGIIYPNFNLKLNNDYNSFSISGNIIPEVDESTHTKLTDSKLELISDGTVKYTGNSRIDEKYVYLHDLPNVNITLCYVKDEKNNPIYISIENFELHSPISANTTQKDIRILNQYEPIISDLSSLEKYAMYYEDGITKINTEYIGLGMSSGGSDNQGGGGMYHVLGSVVLNKNGNKLEQTATYPESGTLNYGNSGYDVLPNEGFSKYISTFNSNLSIVPILMVNAGTNMYFSNGNKKHYFSTTGDRDKSKDGRLKWFLETLPSTYRTMWMFIKSSNNSLITYSPLNDFINFTYNDNDEIIILNTSNINSNGEITGDISKNQTLSNLLTSLLALLYIRVSDKTISKYTVEDIDYLDTLIYKLTISGNCKISDIQLSINNINLNDLHKIFLDNCLTTNNIKESLPYSFDKTITLKNKYLEVYLQYKSGIVTLDNYLYGDWNNDIEIDGSNLSNICYINSEENKLTKLDARAKFYLISSFKYNDEERLEKVSFTNIPLNISELTLLNLLYSNNLLTIIENKYNKANSLYIFFGNHNISDGCSAVKTRKISLFNKSI